MLLPMYIKINPVLCNMLEADGGNDSVEQKCGKKHSNIKIVAIIKGIHNQINAKRNKLL